MAGDKRRRGRVGGGSPSDRWKRLANIDDDVALASQRAKVASNFSSRVVAAALVLVGLLSKTSKTFERRRRFRLRDVEPVQLLGLVLVLVDDDDRTDDANDVESWRVAAAVELERGTEYASFSCCSCCWHDDIGTLLSSVIVNNDLGRCKGCGAIWMLRSVALEGFFRCFVWYYW